MGKFLGGEFRGGGRGNGTYSRDAVAHERLLVRSVDGLGDRKTVRLPNVVVDGPGQHGAYREYYNLITDPEEYTNTYAGMLTDPACVPQIADLETELARLRHLYNDTEETPTPTTTN